MNVSIAPSPLDGAIRAAVLRAEGNHGSAIRADSRYSPPAVAAQRAMLRQTALEAAIWAHRVKGRPEVPMQRVDAIVRAQAEALGLREQDGRIDGIEARTDSMYLPGELIARDQSPHRVRDQRRAVQESVQSRTIDAGAAVYQSAVISYEGEAGLYKPGDTDIHNASHGVGADTRQVYSIVVKTQMDWEQALYGGNSSINQAAEDAESAGRALRRSWERFLVTGKPGTDLRSLFGAQKLPGVAVHHSTVDYSASATTLGAIYADLQAFARKIQEAHDYRGPVLDTLMIAPHITARIAERSNIDAGGNLTGAELLAQITAQDRTLAATLGSMGVTGVIPAPSIGRVAGASGSGTKHAGAVLFERGAMEGLRRVLALAPSPVRTADELTGQATLWALRTGGLECPDATAAGVGTFKVR